MGNLTKYCILVYRPDSTMIASQWFPTVLAIIFLLCGGLFNVYCGYLLTIWNGDVLRQNNSHTCRLTASILVTRKFPILEGIMLTIHWAAWIAIIVTLWVTSPRGKASEVLFTFTNGGGWPSAGAATLAGTLSAWSVFVGYDSSVHMTENAKDASKTIPFSMGIAFVVNAFLAFIMAITLIFCVGDVDAVVAETTLTPFIVIFRNSTGSKAATVVMVVPIILTFWSALISQLATASRQLWAFARDGGVPWAHQLAPVYYCFP